MSVLRGFLLLLLGPPLTGCAADVLVLKTGERRLCHIAGVEGENLLLLSQPVKELPAILLPCPRQQVASIEFDQDSQLERQLKEATRLELPELRLIWGKFSPLLGSASSPSGKIGLRLGLRLLEERSASSSLEALTVFSNVASEASATHDREAARQGKLRAWTALGKLREAGAEAELVLNSETGASLAAEARLVLAAANESALVTLLDENPRWEEDNSARAQRTALYHKTLDLFLLAALLPGGSPELAMRGLWGAMGVHRRCGEHFLAAETARDLIAFYPASSFAKKASEFLETLPSEIRERAPAPASPAANERPFGPPTTNSDENNLQSDPQKEPAPAAASKRRKRSRN
jgi:hypothetical protein